MRAGWVLALTVACGPRLWEGDEPFECEDGADNDRDGAFDCDDPDCHASPSCDGLVPDPTDDTDPVPDPAVAADLQAVTLVYTQAHDVGAGDPTVDALACDSYGLCDCALAFAGTGTFLSADGDRVTFLGTWTRTSDGEEGACEGSFESGTWVPEDGIAHHSFRFTGGLAELDQWVAHADVDEVDPRLVPSLVANEQFAIWDMAAELDPGTLIATHGEEGTGLIELFTVRTTHALEVRFTAR